MIDEKGTQVGIVSTDEAQAIADEKDLDLVEVSPMARPPVCRIMDYGKFMYEQRRKEKELKKQQHRVQLKEVQLRPNIETHDFDFKMKHARKFILAGNKVKVALSFRGREMAHKDRGRAVLLRVRETLGDIAVPESEPKLVGRNFLMIMVPSTSTRQKRKDERDSK